MTKWRPIPSAPAFEASSAGAIRRIGSALSLAAHIQRNGYVKIRLCDSGVTITRWVHRLICEAFRGPSPLPRMDAAHRNNVRHDNRASNLRWKTRKQNEAEKIVHGTKPTGERCGMARLTYSKVRELRRRLEQARRDSAGRLARGELAALSRSFDISPSTIWHVATGKTWSHA